MWDSATAHINIFVHCVPKILCGSCPGSSVAPSIRDMTPPFESQRKPINSAYSPSLLTLFTAEGVGLGHELPGKFITSFFINQVLSTPSSSTSLRLRRILYTASVFLVPHPHAKQYPLKLRFLVFVCGVCWTKFETISSKIQMIKNTNAYEAGRNYLSGGMDSPCLG